MPKMNVVINETTAAARAAASWLDQMEGHISNRTASTDYVNNCLLVNEPLFKAMGIQNMPTDINRLTLEQIQRMADCIRIDGKPYTFNGQQLDKNNMRAAAADIAVKMWDNANARGRNITFIDPEHKAQIVPDYTHRISKKLESIRRSTPPALSWWKQALNTAFGAFSDERAAYEAKLAEYAQTNRIYQQRNTAAGRDYSINILNNNRYIAPSAERAMQQAYAQQAMYYQTYTPQMMYQQMYMPQMYMPQMYAPQMYAPQMYAPQMYAPQMYAPQMYAPQMYAPQMYAPQMYAPQMYAPQMYAPLILIPQIIYPHPYAPNLNFKWNQTPQTIYQKNDTPQMFKYEPERKNTPQPEPERKNTPQPEPERKNTPETEPERKNTPQPEPERKNTPQPEPEHKNTPEPESERKNTPQPESERKNTPDPEPERKNTPQPEPERKNTPQPEPERKNTPEPERKNAPKAVKNDAAKKKMPFSFIGKRPSKPQQFKPMSADRRSALLSKNKKNINDHIKTAETSPDRKDPEKLRAMNERMQRLAKTFVRLNDITFNPPANPSKPKTASNTVNVKNDKIAQGVTVRVSPQNDTLHKDDEIISTEETKLNVTIEETDEKPLWEQLDENESKTSERLQTSLSDLMKEEGMSNNNVNMPRPKAQNNPDISKKGPDMGGR